MIVGNGGSEWGPSRGYVTAYDAETGAQRWRWHVIPGNPADGFENDAMEKAARTWTGDWWNRGGGGQAWNAITYDPEFDRVYIGTGNGAPWNPRLRSPGGGDNLYLCSIVALDAKTGEYVWHYQTGPGETWDYSSAMDIALARMEIGGEQRRVLLHAPKNGFFYVNDRDTGELVSAEKFGKVTWASHVDLETGRPVVVDAAKAEAGAQLYAGRCVGCHGLAAVAGGYAPDLRASAVPLSTEAFDSVVRQGSLLLRNMPRFEELTAADLETLRHYLLARARESLAATKAPPAKTAPAAPAAAGR